MRRPGLAAQGHNMYMTRLAQKRRPPCRATDLYVDPDGSRVPILLIHSIAPPDPALLAIHVDVAHLAFGTLESIYR